MYCGDGINDLAALAAADVGMAIGSSDASAAASVSDKHASVSGIGCRKEKKGKEQTTPVGVRLMRSQVLYQAVLGYWLYHTHGGSACLLLFGTVDDSVSVAAPL